MSNKILQIINEQIDVLAEKSLNGQLTGFEIKSLIDLKNLKDQLQEPNEEILRKKINYQDYQLNDIIDRFSD